MKDIHCILCSERFKIMYLSFSWIKSPPSPFFKRNTGIYRNELKTKSQLNRLTVITVALVTTAFPLFPLDVLYHNERFIKNDFQTENCLKTVRTVFNCFPIRYTPVLHLQNIINLFALKQISIFIIIMFVSVLERLVHDYKQDL